MRSFHSTMSAGYVEHYELRNRLYFEVLVELLDDENVAELNSFNLLVVRPEACAEEAK